MAIIEAARGLKIMDLLLFGRFGDYSDLLESKQTSFLLPQEEISHEEEDLLGMFGSRRLSL